MGSQRIRHDWVTKHSTAQCRRTYTLAWSNLLWPYRLELELHHIVDKRKLSIFLNFSVFKIVLKNCFFFLFFFCFLTQLKGTKTVFQKRHLKVFLILYMGLGFVTKGKAPIKYEKKKKRIQQQYQINQPQSWLLKHVWALQVHSVLSGYTEDTIHSVVGIQDSPSILCIAFPWGH